MGKRTFLSHLPGKDQTEQRADEDEHLVEHGRVGPLDGTVEVVLPAQGWRGD